MSAQELEERAAKPKVLAEAFEAPLQATAPAEDADHESREAVSDGPSRDLAPVTPPEHQARPYFTQSTPFSVAECTQVRLLFTPKSVCREIR